MIEKNNWLKKAVKNMDKNKTKGKFTEYCKQKGFTKVTDACISQGLKSSNSTINKRANFAKTMRKMQLGGMFDPDKRDFEQFQNWLQQQVKNRKLSSSDIKPENLHNFYLTFLKTINDQEINYAKPV
jgi:hypothetical protein